MGSSETFVSVLSIVIVLVFFGIIFGVIALIPYVCNAIGLARICKKLDACSPVLAFFPILVYIAMAKASDAADAYNGIERKRPILKHMIISTVFCVLSSTLLIVLAVPTALMMNSLDPVMQLISTVLMLAYLAMFFITYALFLWRTVVCCFCYWRMCNAYSQVLAIIVLAVSILMPNLTWLAMFIVPFFPLKEIKAPEQDDYYM